MITVSNVYFCSMAIMILLLTTILTHLLSLSCKLQSRIYEGVVSW